MTNLKKEEIGKISEVVKNYENGKAFLHDLLGLTSCEISVSAMPAGVKLPFNHKHKQNAKVYIFLKGEGSMTLDNEVVEFKIQLPDGIALGFKGFVSVTIAGGAVGDAMTFTLTINLNSDITPIVD